MTTEKHDPWALLREARNSVALEVAAVAAFRVSDADRRVLDLLKCINAALAAHDAVPPSEEKVETEWENDEERRFVTNIEGARCIVFMHHGQGCWNVLRSGDEDTLDEAKSAAIAAARGLR